jgi:DNA polymerase-4
MSSASIEGGTLPPRRILHLDMDAFFASVELLRQPALRGRPLIIGGRGDPSRRGVVSTCTYEARAFGVRSGMPLRTAARLCPEAVYMPTDFAAYSHWSRRFKALMREVSPLFEDRGIDEAFLDITEVSGSAEV